MMYDIPVWVSNIYKTSLDKFETVQATTLRKIFDLPYFANNIIIKKTVNIPSITNIISPKSEKRKQSIIAYYNSLTSKT